MAFAKGGMAARVILQNQAAVSPSRQGALIESQMENIPHRRMQAFHLAGEQLPQIKVQQSPVLDHTVAKAGSQSRISSIQPVTAQILFQHAVGPAILLAAGDQRIQRRFSGAHYGFRG